MNGPSFVVTVFASLVPLVAPQQSSPLSSVRPDASTIERPEATALSQRATKLELSLDQCVRTVLERNVALQVSELQNASNATSIEQALGAFDPELYATASGTKADQPTASSFQAPSNQSLNGSAGLRGLYRTGLAYDLKYQLAYNRQSPSNPFFGFNPTLSSDLAVSLTQPLLRNFGPTVNEAPVETARLLVARGDLGLFQQVQDTALQAVSAYWDLVRTRRERDTAKTALDVAEQLVTNSKKKQAAGVNTRLDVLTAQTESARRLEALIRAQNAVGRAEDALKLLLSPGVSAQDWQVAIEPTTPPKLDDEPLPDEQGAVLAAFADRADLRQLEVDLHTADLALEVAENRELPKLDLIGSYGYAGLSGKSATGGDKTNVQLWTDSLHPIRDRDFRSWTVGFDFSRPIGNRVAEAGVRKSRMDKETSYMLWLQKRMSIVQELRSALRDVADGKAATEAATQSRQLAQEQYQAEQVRFDNEHSTTFQVREAQRDLFEAQDRETAAITQYEVFFAALERARGRLAQRFGVRWQPQDRVEGALLE